MTGVRINFKSFTKQEFNRQGVSSKKLSNSTLGGDLDTRKFHERQKKGFRTMVSLQRNNVKVLSAASNQDVSIKKPKDHSFIYNHQIRKLKKFDNKIQQQLNTISQRQLQRETKIIDEQIANELKFEFDQYVFVNRYCRNFQLIEQQNKHTDITLVKLARKL